MPEVPGPVPTGPARKQEREGLQHGYAMRADGHYVEHLTARRGEKSLHDSGRMGSDVPERQEMRDRTEKLFAQLTEDIVTIESAVAALASDASRMSRRVNVD